MPALFSDAWAQALADRLNADATYRDAAATWEGDLTFVSTRADGGTQAVYLDLHHGACRSARALDPDETAASAFMLTATEAVWRDILAGRQDPILGMMLGKLSVKGPMATIAAHAPAAKALVACAAAVETDPPAA